ncbi:Gfo/Idh/MocA family protein [Halapricum hydrolyticum]|uniref:Gfo/Idh/MocA family oxidoreductase n=1 Tax=Halapricum hydrolyticum TaxID=2979991 RepID=A0AAE3IED4_9EURY|nr:Gfo/Idh/MocA family oxidoreductase [Halapricum hydrolyticum]MCU4717874.1 Gfo/Idh/MocA family oxidoreductase [Halapricum hydrolyticum]MCU4727039.1 Gfo/Idh/MocA family oxidoreductase [Halapricum hydrolyticum]
MRFGVLSTAKIAREDVIPAIQKSDHEVLAIASRDGDRAAGVAAELDIPRSYGSYEQLLADDDLDAVYNPLPNALHAKWTRKAADAGLHVLCEKPLAEDAEEAAALHEYCDERGVTLMEAFMYRFHPRTERAADIVREELESVHAVDASFKFALRGRPDDIRLDPDLAGGSVMDVGCYAISAARLFLGEPDRVYARTRDSRDSGVDTDMAAILEYDDGSTARVASGFDTPAVQTYRVEAENGWLEVETAFDIAPGEQGEIEYEIDGRHAIERFDPVDQYTLEVEHFAESVASGTVPRIDAAETVANMAVIDAVFESAADGSRVDVDRPY